MPQKKKSKTPFVILGILALAVLVSVVSLWSVFGNAHSSLTRAAQLSLSQIDYITLRYEKENGISQVKKITDSEEIKNLYGSLSHTEVSKRVCFGAEMPDERNNISIKLKSGKVVSMGSSNRFDAQNSGLLSAFFVCYYDVVSPAEFEETVSHYAA